MNRRVLSLVLLAVMTLAFAGCRKNIQNPIANVDSKQPDKVLFDRAMDAMTRKKWDVARLTLQTLINTYPDSEFIARAKLAVGDAWYNEGGSTGLAQAEIEYKDFITFFPDMPEAAEAQLKVANIHYRQMEKPDRDYTHAKRAEDEYKQLLLQFPDSKLADEAKLRLLQVQEVLAEREYRIGRFYYMRQSFPAAIARLKSLADAYPLYSSADDALWMLGQIHEKQADTIRNSEAPEKVKERFAGEAHKKAIEAYTRIILRYPVTARAEDAKARLTELGLAVPTPTPEAIAQNQAEEASRGETGKLGTIMLNFKKRPDVAAATKVGEPTMVEPRQTNATDVVRQNAALLMGAQPGGSTAEVTAETTGSSAQPGANQAAPRSEEAPAPPPQVNEVNQPQPEQEAQVNTSAEKDKDAEKNTSSSKKKKKKGLRKIVPW